jgi:hypothetical protein
MNRSPIAHTLASVVIGQPLRFENLVMFPLLERRQAGEAEEPRKHRRIKSNGASRDPRGAGANRGESRIPDWYHVLDDAITGGFVEITEVSDQGSVPELRVVNRGLKPALIVDGEELVGAKQNRVVNLSILVAAQSELTIPVSCVEAGRWRARSRAFSAAPRTQYASGRARRMAQVTRSMQASGRYYSDQAEVWSDIAHKAALLHSSSPTGAMEAIFVDHAAFLDASVAALKPVDRQIGATFMIGDRVIGFDLFDVESTLRKLLPKLVRSAAVEVLEAKETGASRDARAALLQQSCAQFLAVVAGAPAIARGAVGLGEDVRITGHGLAGAALVANGHVVHLSAFAM